MVIDRSLHFFLQFPNRSLLSQYMHYNLASEPGRGLHSHGIVILFLLAFYFSPSRIDEIFLHSGRSLLQWWSSHFGWMAANWRGGSVCMAHLGFFHHCVAYNFYSFTYPHAIYGLHLELGMRCRNGKEREGEEKRGKEKERATSWVFLLVSFPGS